MLFHAPLPNPAYRDVANPGQGRAMQTMVVGRPACSSHNLGFLFDGLKGFNTEELKRIYANTTGDPIPKRCEGWEMMFGLVYNAVSNLMDDTDCMALYGKLGREPSQPNANERPKDTAPSVQRTGGTGKRSSGQRELIFEYADKKWAELGKPTDPKEIGRMRKAIMDELEPQGVKRTTCSTTLGAWQKQLQLA